MEETRVEEQIIKEKKPVKVEFMLPGERDYKEFEETLQFSKCLDDRIKITATSEDGDIAVLYCEKEKVNRLGEEYIRDHATMDYSEVLEEWFLYFSQNDYYNDPIRNPEKVIELEFCRNLYGREIYKEKETKRHFMRENFYPRENFAKWYILGEKLLIDDACGVRPNLIFKCGDQLEKVRYDDWNGVATYEMFNRDFHREEICK